MRSDREDRSSAGKAQVEDSGVDWAVQTFGLPVPRAHQGPTPTAPATAGPSVGDGFVVVAPARSVEAGIGSPALIVVPDAGQSCSIVISVPPDMTGPTSVAVSAALAGDPAGSGETDDVRAMAGDEGEEIEEDPLASDGLRRAGDLREGGAPSGRGLAYPAGRMLATWAMLLLLLHGSLWLSGARSVELHRAVEQGAARAEARSAAEASDTATRKAIRAQRATLMFWTTLAMIGDFVIDPVSMAVRALLVATLLSALAAMVGRPIGFGPALDDCATAQGFWVVGAAVEAGLILALRTPDVETSMVLLLPAGTYPAPLWVALRQLDPFAVLGWAALIRGGWRRGQANLVTSAVACGLLAIGELGCRVAFGLITGGAMRLMLLPERL